MSNIKISLFKLKPSFVEFLGQKLNVYIKTNAKYATSEYFNLRREIKQNNKEIKNSLLEYFKKLATIKDGIISVEDKNKLELEKKAISNSYLNIYEFDLTPFLLNFNSYFSFDRINSCSISLANPLEITHRHSLSLKQGAKINRKYEYLNHFHVNLGNLNELKNIISELDLIRIYEETEKGTKILFTGFVNQISFSTNVDSNEVFSIEASGLRYLLSISNTVLDQAIANNLMFSQYEVLKNLYEQGKITPFTSIFVDKTIEQIIEIINDSILRGKKDNINFLVNLDFPKELIKNIDNKNFDLFEPIFMYHYVKYIDEGPNAIIFDLSDSFEFSITTGSSATEKKQNISIKDLRPLLLSIKDSFKYLNADYINFDNIIDQYIKGNLFLEYFESRDGSLVLRTLKFDMPAKEIDVKNPNASFKFSKSFTSSISENSPKVFFDDEIIGISLKEQVPQQSNILSIPLTADIIGTFEGIPSGIGLDMLSLLKYGKRVSYQDVQILGTDWATRGKVGEFFIDYNSILSSKELIIERTNEVFETLDIGKVIKIPNKNFWSGYPYYKTGYIFSVNDIFQVDNVFRQSVELKFLAETETRNFLNFNDLYFPILSKKFFELNNKKNLTEKEHDFYITVKEAVENIYLDEIFKITSFILDLYAKHLIVGSLIQELHDKKIISLNKVFNKLNDYFNDPFEELKLQVSIQRNSTFDIQKSNSTIANLENKVFITIENVKKMLNIFNSEKEASVISFKKGLKNNQNITDVFFFDVEKTSFFVNKSSEAFLILGESLNKLNKQRDRFSKIILEQLNAMKKNKGDNKLENKIVVLEHLGESYTITQKDGKEIKAIAKYSNIFRYYFTNPLSLERFMIIDIVEKTNELMNKYVSNPKETNETLEGIEYFLNVLLTGLNQVFFELTEREIFSLQILINKYYENYRF